MVITLFYILSSNQFVWENREEEKKVNIYFSVVWSSLIRKEQIPFSKKTIIKLAYISLKNVVIGRPFFNYLLHLFKQRKWSAKRRLKSETSEEIHRFSFPSKTFPIKIKLWNQRQSNRNRFIFFTFIHRMKTEKWNLKFAYITSTTICTEYRLFSWKGFQS